MEEIEKIKDDMTGGWLYRCPHCRSFEYGLANIPGYGLMCQPCYELECTDNLLLTAQSGKEEMK